jgi:Glycosyltransferase Family 4
VRDGASRSTHADLPGAAHIPDLHIRPVDFGRGFTRAGLAKALTIVGTLPAVFDLIGLARYIRRQHIAIIHTSDRPRDEFACVLLARLTGAKSIVHAHVGFGEWMSPLLTYALRRADARVAVSEFVARTLTARGHDPGTTHVVLNAIDPAARRAAGRRGGDPRRSGNTGRRTGHPHGLACSRPRARAI